MFNQFPKYSPVTIVGEMSCSATMRFWNFVMSEFCDYIVVQCDVWKRGAYSSVHLFVSADKWYSFILDVWSAASKNCFLITSWNERNACTKDQRKTTITKKLNDGAGSSCKELGEKKTYTYNERRVLGGNFRQYRNVDIDELLALN